MRRHCPHCHHPTIPLRHALLGQILSKPITCSHCGHTLVRVFDILELSLFVPMLVVIAFVAYQHYPENPKDVVLGWFLYACAALSGICLWAHTIRYKVKTD